MSYSKDSPPRKRFRSLSEDAEDLDDESDDSDEPQTYEIADNQSSDKDDDSDFHEVEDAPMSFYQPNTEQSSVEHDSNENEKAAIAPYMGNSVAYNIISKMGWKHGAGLGKFTTIEVFRILLSLKIILI